MFKLAKPFFIICETPLHAGSGDNLGVVDLPIQRERHTDFPKIEGSSLKGCIREAFEEQMNIKDEWFNKKIGENLEKIFKNVKTEYRKAISLAFGPEGEEAHAGALGFTDARLLLFPVKSMKGVFAFITCPKVLKRFKTDLELCNLPENSSLKNIFKDGIPQENTISNLGHLAVTGNVILEEYTFLVKEDEKTKNFAQKLSANQLLNIPEIADKLVVLSDDDFRDFVNLSTEVITRTKISNLTGTVEQGALFTEEYLPTESILYSLVLTSPIFKEEKKEKGIFAQDNKKEEDLVMEFFQNGIPEVIQLGGNATIGKGIVRIQKVGGEQNVGN